MAGAGINDAPALVHAKIGTVTGSMVTKAATRSRHCFEAG